MTLDEFKSVYKTIDKLECEKRDLFESICYLLEKEPKNPKVIEAIEITLFQYANHKVVQEYDGRNEPYNVSKLYLQGVPTSVAEAFIRRANCLKKIEQDAKIQRDNKIIDLLKFDDDLQK